MTPIPGLLFDEHVNAVACRQLQAQGVDVVHVLEVGLEGASDPDVLQWAIASGRVVVTRNYRDFAPLALALARRGEPFPGVLFLPSSIPQGDVGAHVRAVQAWIAARAAGETSVENGFGWLS